MTPGPRDRAPHAALSHARSRQIAGAFGWTLVAALVRMAAGLASVPLMLGTLGPERYAVLALAMGLVPLATFVEGGITPSLRNRLVAALAIGDKPSYGRLRGICLTLPWVGLGVACAAAAIALLGVPPGLAAGSYPGEAAQAVAILLFFGMAAVGLSGIECLHAAEGRVGLLRRWEVAVTAAVLLATWAAAEAKSGLAAFAALAGAPLVLARLGAWCAMSAARPATQFAELVRFIAETRRDALFLLWTLGMAALTSAIPLAVAGWLCTLEEVAAFAVSLRLASLPVAVAAAALAVLWPYFTFAWSRGEGSWVATTLGRLSLAAAALCLPAVAAAWVAGPSVVGWWTDGAVRAGETTLALLALWASAQVLHYLYSTFLHAVGDLRFEAGCYAALGLLHALGTIGLGVAFGTAGIAAGMATACLIAGVLPSVGRFWLHHARRDPH